MADNKESKTEGYLFVGKTNKEKTLSFGLASKRNNKFEGKYSYTPVGVEINRTFGDNNLGLETTISAELGKVETGFSFDKSTIIPGITAKAEANLAKMSAEAELIRSGIKNDLIKAEVGAFGIGAKFEAGGHRLPVALANANTFKGKVSAGFGDAQLDFSPGKGEGSKLGFEISNFDNPIKSGQSSSNMGDYSLSIPGLLEHDFGTGETKSDFGNDTTNLGDAYKSLEGRGGEKVGSIPEIYSDKHNRNLLLEDASKEHVKNDKTLKRTEGKNSLFSGRKNVKIADSSKGYIDQIDKALGYLNREKSKVDQKRIQTNLKPAEYDSLAKQSDSYKAEIDKFTEARNNLSVDENRANKNVIPENELIQRPSTNDIVADAYKNANEFEKGFKKDGLGNHLADSATGICQSNNALSNRISEINVQISDNNKDISRIQNIRNGVLESGKYKDLQDAINHNVPGIDKLNEREAALREENNKLRAERGECQKASLETHKNFNPSADSEKFEKNGRDLKGKEIDNNNAILAKKDEITNYCNSHGIGKDKDGEYSNKQDEGLNNLLAEKRDLEKESDYLKSTMAQNDKDLKDSELKGKSSLTVETNGSNADVKHSSDDYGARYSLNDRDDQAGKQAAEQNHHESDNKERDVHQEEKKSEMPTKTSISDEEKKQSEMPSRFESSRKENAVSEMPSKAPESKREGVGTSQNSGMPITANGTNDGDSPEGKNKSQNIGMGM